MSIKFSHRVDVLCQDEKAYNDFIAFDCHDMHKVVMTQRFNDTEYEGDAFYILNVVKRRYRSGFRVYQFTSDDKTGTYYGTAKTIKQALDFCYNIQQGIINDIFSDEIY